MKIVIISFCVSIFVAFWSMMGGIYLADFTAEERRQNFNLVLNTAAIDANTAAVEVLSEATHIHKEGPSVVADGNTVCLHGLIQTEFDPVPFGVLLCAEVTVKEDTDAEKAPAVAEDIKQLRKNGL